MSQNSLDLTSGIYLAKGSPMKTVRDKLQGWLAEEVWETIKGTAD